MMPAKKTSPATEKAVAAETVIETKQNTPTDCETQNTEPAERVVYRVKEVLSPTTFITVRNGFNGKLVYRSRKTGERFVWESFGDEQDIELQELKNAKSASRLFFENNWFMIEDPEVIEYLGVERYYRNALSIDDFDEIFEMKPDVIKDKVGKLSPGQKNSLAYRARQKIKSEEIDSLKVIDALEKSLGIELIER